MSEHDDTLLDEDLGDEEYDLGNDEEEALLADDYELERQNSYKGEEETDDVLDLGVTDALDDLDAEDENVEFSRSKTDQNNENDFYETEDRSEVRSKYYEQDENNAYENEQARQYQEHSAADTCNSLPGNSNIGKGDLREKLQKNVQKLYVGNGQGMEDDDCEEAKERRNRFQNERTIVSPKMNTDIPDSLESVVTSEPSCRASLRGRGRGRGARGIRGGGRFNTQTAGHFNQRFGAPRNPNFDSQQPACRSPLLETRPPFLLGVPNNMQNQQIPYQQANPQVQPYRHYSPNGPLQGPNHFLDNRPQFGSNQFQGQVAPRIAGPRMDYGPRGILPGNLQRPPYACQPNQPPNHPPNHPANQPGYVQIQSGPFFANNQAPVLQGPGGLLLPPEPNPSMSGTSTSLLQGNQALPVQGFQRHPNHPNLQIPNQPPFENRGTFQDSHFEGRPMYNTRSGYSDQPPTRQFNNAALSGSQQPPTNIPNVPLPPGHKILINPHFRGAVQPSNDARLAWDSPQQQGPAGSQVPPGQFSQSASYQNQPPYGHAQEDPQRPFQPNYQQNKSDDPYAYFSDVWQENKSRRAHQSVSPTKQYPPETGYTRESSYGDSVPKYKPDGQWEQKDRYQEEQRIVHPNYRNRDVPSKARGDSLPKNRLLSTNVYRGDMHDQNHTQKSSSSRSMNTSGRGVCRLPQKRVSDPMEKPPRDSSPKRMKPVNRNLQEVRTVDTISDAPAEKKEEDSDPEMQEYRKKMEEQKRLREKILREKENRRKMAAMEKQNEETKNPSNIAAGGNTQQDGKPTSSLVGAVKDGVTSKDQPGIARGRGRPFAVQRTETGEKSTGLRIVRTIQTVEANESAESGSAKDVKSAGLTITQSIEHVQTKQHLPSQPTRRVVIQKPLGNSQKIATSIQKTVSNLQKGQLAVHNKANSGASQSTGQKLPQVQQPGIVKKAVGASPKTGSTAQRTVTQKIPGSLQKTVINIQDTNNGNAHKGLATAQNHQRVVLQKAPAPQKKLTEIKTNTVRLENLAASTSESQIKRMCQGIGTIESIEMGERNATIVFKTPSAAMVFHKKYQRKMLDLSLITVRLVPNPSANGPKSTSSLTKTT